MTSSQDAITALKALLRADPELKTVWSQASDIGQIVQAATASAQRHGIALDAAQLHAQLRDHLDQTADSDPGAEPGERELTDEQTDAVAGGGAQEPAGLLAKEISAGSGILKSVASSLISSQAVKQDVCRVQNPPDLLASIVPVEFRYTDDVWAAGVSQRERDRRHVGFIAEDVPAAAQICDPDGVPYDVDARAMVAFLWAEVQALRAEVTQLRDRIPTQALTGRDAADPDDRRTGPLDGSTAAQDTSTQVRADVPSDIPDHELDDVTGGVDPARIAALADLSEADLLNRLKQSLSQY